MAKINRFYQKIFGSNAGQNQISVFGSKAAGAPAYTNDPEQVQSLGVYLNGWFSATQQTLQTQYAPRINDRNALDFMMTSQLAYILQAGIPEWNSLTSYYINSLCQAGGVIYKSLIDDNLNIDPLNRPSTASWIPYSTTPTGSGSDYYGTTAPDGWVFANNSTIGSSASGAARANDDTKFLFNLLWSVPTLLVLDSTGAATTKGTSAALDFAANKRLFLPDKRGRVSAMVDVASSGANSRLGNNIANSTTIGSSGGVQDVTLTIAQMPRHTHIQETHSHLQQRGTTGSGLDNTQSSTAFIGGFVGSNAYTQGTTVINLDTGGDGSHTNVQPTYICNYIIKL